MLVSPPLDTSVFEFKNVKRVVLSCYPSIKAKEHTLSDDDWKQIHKDYKEIYFPKEIVSGIFIEKSWVPLALEETTIKPSKGQYHSYPADINIDISLNYGVCDNYEQILENIPQLVSDPDRKFFIILKEMLKSEQPKYGGWRWCKWGSYIGTQNSVADYLFDEPEVEKIICFQIHQFEI